MTRKKLYLIIITAVLITIAQLLMNPYRTWNRSINLNVGQIAEQEIISPIEFNVYKSEENLSRERKNAEDKIDDIYTISDNITFNAIRNLDIIIRHFENNGEEQNGQEINKTLVQKGYKMSENSIMYLMKPENRNRVYGYLSEKLARVLDIGIYPESYSAPSINVKRKGVVKNYYLFKLYAFNEARDKILDGYSDSKGKTALADIIENILVVNIILDRETTERLKQKARIDIDITAGKVLKNETIIRKGERVNEGHLQKLASLQRAMKTQNLERNNRRVITSCSGTFIFSLLLLLIFFNLLEYYKGSIEMTERRTNLLLIFFLFGSLISLSIHNIFELPSLLIPVSFFTFAIMKLYNRQISFLYTITQLILVSLLLNWNFINPMLLSLASLAILLLSYHVSLNVRYLTLTLSEIVLYILLTLGLSLNQVLPLGDFFQRVLLGSASILISTILAVLFIPYLEKRLRLVTRETLMELLDVENPLLRRMSREMPGTYHHSLVVGNLSESASEAIGADHLLARVGSYFHDLGKLANPRIYIENNAEANEVHDNMLATQSAQLIRGHILEGVRLARLAGLPESVIDIIRQHHGTSKIRYFLNKAQENHLDYDAEEFEYPGPKPLTQEAAIIMIADIVESHSKSLTEINSQILDQLLDETINKLIKDGQLNQAPVTISDLRKIANAMHPILLGVYSTRIEYPEDD
ncbi:MAG: HDIG domain-containing protein [Candidatus Stygibacter australis]|nr:HDIG domain-containing protein [Candidatus Stygibacter australis]MDP8323450.1 HDIG domain-containing protein [Candidatus Stygibacter australis]